MRTTILTTILASVLVLGASAQRRENQQDRIADGVKSGSLTAGETSRLESKEAAVNHEIRADRALNGGRLTNQEKRIVNGQQNQLSKQIYKDKHNPALQHYGKKRWMHVGRTSRIALPTALHPAS